MGLHLLFDAGTVSDSDAGDGRDKSPKDAERSQTPMIRLPKDSRVYC